MSGIFGYQIKSKELSCGILPALKHWNRFYGKEGYGETEYGSVGLGCCLEHLADRFPASSPVLVRNGRTAAVDAILYNRAELLSALGSDGENCSDEELLLNWIDDKGFDALAEVNGDFSGAIWDENNSSWILFRDHSGVRPLFYYIDENLFAFSTDLRGLTALPGVDLCLNEEKLYLRMAGYNDLTLCETEYEKIRCIRPAAWTELRETETGFEMKEHVYWKWGQNKIRLKDDQAYQHELRRLITDAVQRRLDAFPGLVGCELSGGLDSSVIAILINRLGREGRFHSWSYSEEDIPLQKRDERKIIRDICEQEGISCHYSRIRPIEPINNLFDKINPPYQNTGNIFHGSTYFAEQGARVVFTGHGGDEGVSHRCNLYELWYHREYGAFFRNIYRATRGKNLRLLRMVKNALVQIFVTNRYFRRTYQNEHCNAAACLNPDFADRIKTQVQPMPLPFAYDPIAYIMQGGHRPRLDNVAVQGAEGGVRYMLPFIDYRVLDYALSIPRAQFHNGYSNRYIYRAAFDDMIPQSLRDMRYKDTPSQANYMPKVDLFAHFIDSRDGLLSVLDRDYWAPYLNLDMISKVEMPKDYQMDDYYIAVTLVNEISICFSIQNTAQRSAEWEDKDE